MSHVTQEQAKKLKELGLDQNFGEEAFYKGRLVYKVDFFLKDAPRERLYVPSNSLWESAPSAEELMEWLKEHVNSGKVAVIHLCRWEDNWRVDCGDEIAFYDKKLINALFQATCWVLEGKK